MRILLTNDDGVYAPGIAAIYEELKKIGTVTVVAPEAERSSISQAITLNHPLYHKVVSVDGRFKAHALSGTPADCVKFGLTMIMKKKPDLIVSGINNGSNDGCSVFYSGTVGAAREGALMGVPSLAISLDSLKFVNFLTAAKISAKIIQWILRIKLPQGTFLNINVPDLDIRNIRGVRLTEQCRIPIHGEFKIKRNPAGRKYYWLTGRPLAKKNDRRTDSYALQEKYVTVTPIHCDGTDYTFLHQMKKRGFDILI